MPDRKNSLLRNMQESDLEQVLEWRNSDRIRASMFSDQLITMDEHVAWFRRLQKERHAIYKVFEYLGQAAGVVNFSQFDKVSNRCSWGFYLGREDLPRGTGVAMGQLGLQFIFEELQVRKLCGEVLAFNTASIKFHQKLEFKEEGKFTQHVLKNGRYEDVISFSLFKSDYVTRSIANETI